MVLLKSISLGCSVDRAFDKIYVTSCWACYKILGLKFVDKIESLPNLYTVSSGYPTISEEKEQRNKSWLNY